MRSFTLLEIIIATLIFTLLILAVFQAMEIGRNSWFTGEISVELRQEIIKAFTVMERELKETRPALLDLNSATTATSLTFRLPQDNDADGTILDASGNIEWSGQITYALNGAGQITRTEAGNTTILANNVTGLTFSRPLTPVNIVQVDIATAKTTFTGRQLQDTGQVVVKLRN